MRLPSLIVTQPLPTGWRRWLLAARPATLWAGVAPVLAGSALAHRPCPSAGSGCAGVASGFRWDVFVAALIVALAVQVAVNFANDVADAARGADTADRTGPARAVASGLISPRLMWAGIAAAFGVAAVAGLYLFTVRGWPVLVIGVASVIAALGYTSGPKPYGYNALGEVFVFVFFGLVATVGTHYVHTGAAPAAAWILGAVMGLLASAILVANNVRDIETDAAAAKRTLAVVLGRDRAVILYIGLLAVAFGTLGVAAVAGAAPRWTALGLAAAPLAFPLVRTMLGEPDPPALIGVLKGTARLQLAVALLLVAGALIDGG